MQKAQLKKINVTAIFAGFRTPGISRRITPRVIHFPNGETHKIEHIRRSYTEKVGDALHVHFVVKTANDRYFDIVYDSKKMCWLLVVELEEILFFND
jgi:hypothetical protein